MLKGIFFKTTYVCNLGVKFENFSMILMCFRQTSEGAGGIKKVIVYN